MDRETLFMQIDQRFGEMLSRADELTPQDREELRLLTRLMLSKLEDRDGDESEGSGRT